MGSGSDSAGGFSLIEVMMVLVVVVLLTSLVSLNLDSGTSSRDLQSRVEALLALASLALDEAQDTGSDYGLLLVQEVDTSGEPYVQGLWRQRLIVGWRDPVDPDGVFEPLEFPSEVELTLILDGVAVALTPAAVAADENLGRAPQWLFTASGETQTGELVFSDREGGATLWRLTWDALGRFERFRGDNLDAEESYAQQG